MPTYDYRCSACSHEFEQFQSMKDKPLRKCPSCGKSALERLIGTGAAIIFKGSGFYQTDYRPDAYKKAAEADKPPTEAPKSDASKPDAAKPDSKPDSKADSKADTKTAKPEPAKPTKDRPKPAKGKRD
jgi:putative FmdB family regulatory protein